MRKLIVYCIALICLSSCASQKPITSSIHPFQIKKVGILPSYNYVKVLAARSEEEVKDEDYTAEIGINSEEAITKFFDDQKIEHENVSFNPEEGIIIQKEIADYYTKLDADLSQNSMRDPKKFNYQANRDVFGKIRVSDRVVKILQENNLRFALATVTIGFTRTHKNEVNRKWGNAGKLVLGAAVAGLTGFGVFFRGIPYRSVTYFFLIDAEKKNLSLYTKKMAEIDPLNKSSLQGQLTFGLEDYWLWYASKVKF
jgi:hypothetical protein